MLKYLIPTVMFLVASFQFVQTRNGLSRWKGAGFGMYSQIHFNRNEVWIGTLGDSLLNIKSSSRYDDDLKKLLRKAKRFPNEKNLASLSERMILEYGNDSLIIQVWEPLLDLDKFTFSRRKLNEYRSY